jgi:hypothetical protein
VSADLRERVIRAIKKAPAGCCCEPEVYADAVLAELKQELQPQAEPSFREQQAVSLLRELLEVSDWVSENVPGAGWRVAQAKARAFLAAAPQPQAEPVEFQLRVMPPRAKAWSKWHAYESRQERDLDAAADRGRGWQVETRDLYAAPQPQAAALVCAAPKDGRTCYPECGCATESACEYGAAPQPQAATVPMLSESSAVPDDYRNQASGYRAGWNDCNRCHAAPQPQAASREDFARALAVAMRNSFRERWTMPFALWMEAAGDVADQLAIPQPQPQASPQASAEDVAAWAQRLDDGYDSAESLAYVEFCRKDVVQSVVSEMRASLGVGL